MWKRTTTAGRFTSTTPTELVVGLDTGLTYLDDDDAIRAVDARGRELWHAAGLRPIGVTKQHLAAVGPGGGGLSQQIALVGLDPVTGVEVWRKVVTGFHAALIEGSLVVLDQTNGTATELSDHSATVSAYDVADGARQWDTSIPLAFELFHAGRFAVLETTGDQSIAAVDTTTHRLAWATHYSNPGRSERYHDSDSVLDTGYDRRTGTLFVLLVAQEPYRD